MDRNLDSCDNFRSYAVIARRSKRAALGELRYAENGLARGANSCGHERTAGGDLPALEKAIRFAADGGKIMDVDCRAVPVDGRARGLGPHRCRPHVALLHSDTDFHLLAFAFS